MDKLKLLLTAFMLVFFAGSVTVVANSVGNQISTEYSRFISPLLAMGLLLGIHIYILSRIFTTYLRDMSTEELKSAVFTYHNEYFDFIGHGDESVRRFKMLLLDRDIQSLKREWKSFEKTFRKLEIAAGHQGRPLIMDYYLDYIYAAKLLEKRMRYDS
jgi:hypothetical protein